MEDKASAFMVFMVVDEVDTIYLSKKGRNTGNKFDILVYKFVTFKEYKQMIKTAIILMRMQSSFSVFIFSKCLPDHCTYYAIMYTWNVSIIIH